MDHVALRGGGGSAVEILQNQDMKLIKSTGILDSAEAL